MEQQHPTDAPTGEHEHDLGLQHDVKVLNRRRLLGIFGAVGASVALAGCVGGESTSTSSPTGFPGGAPGGPGGQGGPGGSGGAESGVQVAEGEIPEETAGPYPGDGSNGPNVLSEDGVVRSDITGSFGEATGVAAGVPLTLRMRVLDLNGEESEPLAGAAVYAWHCDRDGNYSMYDGDAEAQNYLRGVQVSDANGWVSFTTIFPGCYAGRWPHVHFEVYPSLAKAVSAENKLRTSQLAFPAQVCEVVYASDGYATSVANLASVSLASDNVFADGHSLQLAKVSGSVARGYVATLNVPI